MERSFNDLVKSFKSSIKTWDYFVNWKKVFSNYSNLEIALNKLNYLLGKEDLAAEFNRLYASNPDIVKALPILLAIRESKVEVFDKVTKDSEFFDFTEVYNSADTYYKFLEKSGLVRLFQKDGVKNLVDYVMGVEVGLDSNGRKNRGGTIMEDIVESFIGDFCKKRNFEYLSQASATDIKDKWGLNVEVDKSERSFDFAIYNPESNKVKLLETNFYNGGGSKLKAVCGEFRNLYTELSRQGIDFLWITDGLGWTTTKRPLEEAFNHNNGRIYNLSMLEDGVLEDLDW